MSDLRGPYGRKLLPHERMTTSNDLRERLEAVGAWLRLERARSQMGGALDHREPVIAQNITTLREVLDHPERLMGKPVALVEVVDTHERPYNFYGKKLMARGRHHLYAAPKENGNG